MHLGRNLQQARVTVGQEPFPNSSHWLIQRFLLSNEQGEGCGVAMQEIPSPDGPDLTVAEETRQAQGAEFFLNVAAVMIGPAKEM